MSERTHHEGVGHVISLRVLFTVLGILLGLTFITVAITWFDLGPFNLITALAIATVKASLVALYFMHLRWDRPFNAVVLLLSLAMLGLFVVLTLLDRGQYQPDLIPGYSPDLDR